MNERLESLLAAVGQLRHAGQTGGRHERLFRALTALQFSDRNALHLRQHFAPAITRESHSGLEGSSLLTA